MLDRLKGLVRRAKREGGGDELSGGSKNPSPSPAPPTKPAPAPDPSEPEKKPGRPSPRPGERPRPVTDPKNYLEGLPEIYFHTLSGELQKLLAPHSPFAGAFARGYFEPMESSFMAHRDSVAERIQRYKNQGDPTELPHTIRWIQKGKEKRIQGVIHSYLEEILGPLYHTVRENLDLQWKDPYDLKSPEDRNLREASLFAEGADGEEEGEASRGDSSKEKGETENGREEESGKEEVDDSYFTETLLRSEFYYLMIQGFGILYMDGFFRMMRAELAAIDPQLPSLYERFHLNGHSTHHRIFHDVMEGNRLPRDTERKMERGHSQGRVWHTTEPVVDPETGNVLQIRSRAHARSEIGVVLAHEALKGVFQLMTPWARLYENYLRKEELRLLRLACGSYWSEIRQFALGPSFLRLFQKFLDRAGVGGSVSGAGFYTAISSAALLPADQLRELLLLVLSEKDLSPDAAREWRTLLLTPPEGEQDSR